MKALYRYLSLVFVSLMILSCSQSEQSASTAAESANVSEGVWIDVRSAAAYEKQHLDGAINIPYSEIVEGVSQKGFSKDEEISLYCGTGYWASKAVDALQEAGYTNVVSRGGVRDVLGLEW